MDRDRALDKLRKLLALARSSNPHEAASARSQASGLMSRYHLTEADVVAHENTDYCELSLGDKGWTAAWRFALVTVAARACGVEAVALQDGRRRKVRLCGERGLVRDAQALYQELEIVIHDLEKLALDEYGDDLGQIVVGDSARDITDAFRQGAVIGLAVAIDMAQLWSTDQQPASADPSAPVNARRTQPDGNEASSSAKVTDSDLPKPEDGDLVVHKPKKKHSEKIHEKYAPKKKPVVAEDEVRERLVFVFARRLAMSRVKFGKICGRW